MDEKILKEEIRKTKEAIKKLKKIKKEQEERNKQLMIDCDVGIEVNTFVLGKLEEEWNSTR